MADAIDPALYAKIFEINKPCWQTVSDSLKKLNLPSDAKILDLGAGPAEPTATILAATPTYKITCTDSQEAMIEKGKMRTRWMSSLIGVLYRHVACQSLGACMQMSRSRLLWRTLGIELLS